MLRRKKQPAADRHPRAGAVETGDHIYFNHPANGPMSGRVVAAGRDGCTTECDRGRRHAVPWDRMLGHKSRVKLAMKVIDAGQEGAIVEDHRGRRRFIGGDLAPPPPGASADPGADTPEPIQRDPLTEGLDRLAKALDDGRPILWLKAGKVANAPGLALRDVTDKAGHQTKRWMRTAPDEKKPREPGKGQPPGDGPGSAPISHGEEVMFRHGGVRGRGAVVSSGRDGVTVRDAQGQTHQVRHDALEGRASEVGPHKPDYAPKGKGQDDKAYFKQHVDSWPDPDHLPEDHGRYFNDHPDAETVPLDKIQGTKAEGDKGARNAPKAMAAAWHGAMGKRDPVSVEAQEDGTYKVVDGNGTTAGVKQHGWKSLPVRVTNRKTQAAEAQAKSLTSESDASLPKEAPQPAATQAELFDRAKPALDELKTWLDKGKGVSSAMGHRLMAKSPDDVTAEEWASDEGMLFIAPLKGEARSREKVEADYGGDWSQLRDVVRCSIAVPTMGDVKGVMDRLRASGMVLAMAPKNRFAKPVPVGYRDLLMNVRLPSGMICEVQLHAKPMLAAKNEGHHWYEVQRGIEAKCSVEKREPTAEESQKLREAEAKQKDIYARAWRAVAGEKDDEPMTKALRIGTARAAQRAAQAGRGGAYEHFEHDGAIYRRPAGSALRSVREVLHGDQWRPYVGADALKPALYGEPIEDPMAKADGGAPPQDDADMDAPKPGMLKALFLRFTGR